MPAPRKEETIPISAIRVLSHKLGFKPVIGCVTCHVQIDLNQATRKERKDFAEKHELCVVMQEERVI